MPSNLTLPPQVAAVYTAIEFMEDHLKKEITIEDIAAAAGYSLYHFIRTFNQIVHHTPYDYLMRRRLSESARELLESQRLILDIALDYQFNNHETYSRAFKRMFAVQPSQWRSLGLIPYRALMPSLSLSYLEHINQAGILKPQFIEREQITLIGLMDQGDEIHSSFWRRLESVLADQEGPQTTRGFYGIHMIRDHKVLFCFVGVEALPGSEIIPPLCRMQIPGGAYVQFLHRGMREDLPLSLDYIYHTWLAKSNYQITQPLEIEYYPDEMPLSSSKITNWYIQLPVEGTGLQFREVTKPHSGLKKL